MSIVQGRHNRRDCEEENRSERGKSYDHRVQMTQEKGRGGAEWEWVWEDKAMSNDWKQSMEDKSSSARLRRKTGVGEEGKSFN